MIIQLDSELLYQKAVKDYYKKTNWKGLLKYLTNLQQRKLLKSHWQWQIGQAYILLGNPIQGLDYLHGLHCHYPDHPDIQLSILDALMMLGKSTEHFSWLTRPSIRRVPPDLIDACYDLVVCLGYETELRVMFEKITRPEISGEVVSSEREPHLFREANTGCSSGQNPGFDEFDLLFALKKDDRFQIMNDTPFFRNTRIMVSPAALAKAA